MIRELRVLWIIVYRMLITGIMGHSSRGDRIHRISFRLGTPMPRACVSWWASEAWDQKICEDVTMKVKLKDKCLFRLEKLKMINSEYLLLG